MRQPDRHSAAEWLIAGCGVWQVGPGLYFIFVRPALLPEGFVVVPLSLASGVIQALATPFIRRCRDFGFSIGGA